MHLAITLQPSHGDDNSSDFPNFSLWKCGECELTDSLLGLQESAQREVGSLRWGDFKPRLADAMVAMLEPIQKQYHEIRADDTYLTQVCSFPQMREPPLT